ncbi:alpha/beta hydrolase [Actinoplanes sp. NPDC048791]|uniref:alpha/beta hydrolase n=1 Tax=Actinoplanes sp. NPDC048791 TaxID=3154623 RepID=UPI0033E902C5
MPTVVFIHGLWLHSTSWAAWRELFEASGYDTLAPEWPGTPDTVAAARESADTIADHGIDDVTSHYLGIIGELGEPPIVVGHSFGGMIAEKLLGLGRVAGAVAVDAAQIKGVLPLPLSALHSTLPVFKNPANRHRAVSLTAEQFRFGFGNAVSEKESDALHERWSIPAPGKPLFEAAAANFSLHSPAEVDTGNEDRGPLLLIAGGQDHTVPEVITKATAKQYRHSTAVTDVIVFPDRGHSLTIDSGWREVATTALEWLQKQGM